MKTAIRISLILCLLVGLYYLGPQLPSAECTTELPDVQVDIDSIAGYVKYKESLLPVKPDNEGIVVWADTAGRPTEYVLLYLHGFSASRYEGAPVTYDFIRKYHANAYLPRLAEHGLNTAEPLLNMTPARLYDSAKEALVIAHKLGRKVIVMGTSTGCTLALMLAADFPQLVDALILYSPNIRIKDKASVLLSAPWGLQIGRLAFGGKYRVMPDTPDSKTCEYWYCRYRVEATIYLQQLLDLRMNRKEFARVKQPVFLGYYYKDEEHQDQTIEVKVALRMFDELGTPAAEKEKVAFPDAGDHVIACELTSKSVEEVKAATFNFMNRIMNQR